MLVNFIEDSENFLNHLVSNASLSKMKFAFSLRCDPATKAEFRQHTIHLLKRKFKIPKRSWRSFFETSQESSSGCLINSNTCTAFSFWVVGDAFLKKENGGRRVWPSRQCISEKLQELVANWNFAPTSLVLMQILRHQIFPRVWRKERKKDFIALHDLYL